MRRILIAAVAALSLGALAPDRSEAMPLTSPLGLKPAIDRISPIDQVRYCEYYDPVLGEWVVFWVRGPCYVVGAPGFDLWIRRWYHGGRHWRGRLHGSPWRHGRGFRHGHRGPRHVGPRGPRRFDGPRGPARVGGPRGPARMGGGGPRGPGRMGGGGMGGGRAMGGGRGGGGRGGFGGGGRGGGGGGRR